MGLCAGITQSFVVCSRQNHSGSRVLVVLLRLVYENNEVLKRLEMPQLESATLPFWDSAPF